MKQITFWAAMAAAMLASCGDQEKAGEDIQPSDRKAITFRVSEQPATRYDDDRGWGTYGAKEANVDSLTRDGSGFAVTAINDEDKIIDEVTFFANESGKSEAVDGRVYYWPNDFSDVSFYAYYPASSSQCALNEDEETMTLTPDGETDIMAAHFKGNALTYDGDVFFDFKHLLTQISVYVESHCDDDDYHTEFVLEDVTIEAPESSTYDFETGRIVANAEKRKYSLIKEAISVFENPESLGTVMVPASNEEKTTYRFYVRYYVMKGGLDIKCYEKTFDCPLSSAGHKSRIHIVITSDCDMIITNSSVLVEEWEDEDAAVIEP